MKVVKWLLCSVLVLSLTYVGYIAWRLYPHQSVQPMPEGLIALDTPAGSAMLAGAELNSDYTALQDNFQAQALISFCGVASSVMVLNALGLDSNQWQFFSEDTRAIRSIKQVMFGGMSLSELSALLQVHGVQVAYKHASDLSLAAFRSRLERNLASPNDFMLVNYQREVLGQGRVGHISPLAAYDADSDRVLILDVASHKYPPAWVEVTRLFQAMNTNDSSSGKTRGLVEVSKTPSS